MSRSGAHRWWTVGGVAALGAAAVGGLQFRRRRQRRVADGHAIAWRGRGGRNAATIAAGTPLTVKLTSPVTVMVERQDSGIR